MLPSVGTESLSTTLAKCQLDNYMPLSDRSSIFSLIRDSFLTVSPKHLGRYFTRTEYLLLFSPGALAPQWQINYCGQCSLKFLTYLEGV